MEHKQRILFITPVKHLTEFYSNVLQNYEVMELIEPTYEDVKIQLPNFDILFCAPNHQTFVIDEDLIKDANVKCILSPSTGLNHIDVDSVPIVSVKNDKVIYDVWSTAEHTLYLMLSIVRGKHELHDKTLGIIGYGRLGKMVETLCKPLFKKIISVDKGDSLDELYKESDVVSLHVHVTDETKYMINKDLFGSIKKDCYIINTSRGEIVNENDIVEGLESGIITGYGTDVIENEFDDLTKSPIINAMNSGENIIVTPHVGGMTIEGQTKAYKYSINKL